MYRRSRVRLQRMTAKVEPMLKEMKARPVWAGVRWYVEVRMSGKVVERLGMMVLVGFREGKGT